MKLVLVALIIAALVCVPAMSDVANMTLTSKAYNVAAGASTPYFYGTITNSSGTMFFMPGAGQQRATLAWYNKFPTNVSLRIEYTDYVVSRAWNITNVSNWVEL